jgi:hypothetical protein
MEACPVDIRHVFACFLITHRCSFNATRTWQQLIHAETYDWNNYEYVVETAQVFDNDNVAVPSNSMDRIYPIPRGD